MTQLTLHLRDIGAPLIEAWRREFDGIAGVEISHGDIFSNHDGPVPPNAPIDIRADAVVSPANSFGFMDGGIDAVYTYQFGPGVQERLQKLIRSDFGGELPVGQAVLIDTGRSEIPWCISAPTMRVPSYVPNTTNAFLALRASILAVHRHNEASRTKIRTILCPGLGTAVGRMPVQRCARQMRIAWQRTALGQAFQPRSVREAEADEAELLR